LVGSDELGKRCRGTINVGDKNLILDDVPHPLDILLMWGCREERSGVSRRRVVRLRWMWRLNG
jgi:hypothetical protein